MVTITTGGPTSPANAAMPPAMPAKPRSEHHRQVDDVRAGQEMAQRKGFVELVRRHPAVLLDDAAPRKHQNAAESRERHFGERDEQRDQTGRRRCRDFRRGTWIGTAAGGESGGMRQDLERQAMQGQPILQVFHPKRAATGIPPAIVARFRAHALRNRPKAALFFSTFAPYIEGAGSPAMEINCRRNKPFGPGGSTRRLHPSPPKRRVSAGANQDRRGRKGRVFSRYGSAVIGLCNSCKRQLCSGCSGCVTRFERPSLKS